MSPLLTSRGKAVERDLWRSQWQMLFRPSFCLSLRVVYVMVVLMLDVCWVQRVALFPGQIFLKFSIFPLHARWEMHFFSFFLDNFPLFVLVNYRGQIRGEMMQMCTVLLFQRATAFSLHDFTGYINQVMCLLQRKKKKDLGKIEPQTTASVLGSIQTTSLAFAVRCTWVSRWPELWSHAHLHRVQVRSASRVSLDTWILSNEITSPSMFQKAY